MTQEVVAKLVEDSWNEVIAPYGKDHTKFMDMADSYGFKVIFPLVSDYDLFQSDSDAVIEKKIDHLVREVGNHTALLMWTIGNEWSLNTAERTPLRDRVNKMINFARDRMIYIWNRQVPITHCTGGIPSTYEPLASKLDVDVFCANGGYDDSIEYIFEGDEKQKGWADIAEETGKPFLFGEIGRRGMNNTFLQDNPEWFNKAWDDIVSNIDNGCIGGNYFEYNDQPYIPEKDELKRMGLTYFQPVIDGMQMSTDPDIFLPDNVIKKPIIYESVQSGSYNGVPINYHTDVFVHVGRNQTHIELYTSRIEPSTPSGSIPAYSFNQACILIMFVIFMY